MKRNRIFQEEIYELEEWMQEIERTMVMSDSVIFRQEQLRERFEQYQVRQKKPNFSLFEFFFFFKKFQTELNIKEYTVRTLVDQTRHELTQSTSPELTHSLESLITNWSNLQKKVDNKLAFYSDVYKLHEELKDLLQEENLWLDNLQNKIYSTTSGGADAEETSEELDVNSNEFRYF